MCLGRVSQGHERNSQVLLQPCTKWTGKRDPQLELRETGPEHRVLENTAYRLAAGLQKFRCIMGAGGTRQPTAPGVVKKPGDRQSSPR